MNSKSLAHLLSEHGLIRRTLGAFSRYLEHGNHHLQREHAEASLLVVYMEDLLFLRHEEKEEVVLLPDLARAGLSWDDGALLHVREDHTKGRYLLDVLKQTLHHKGEWRASELDHFRRAANTWAEFLQEHMSREEDSLFPSVERLVHAELDAKWLNAFERVDREVGDMKNAQELQVFGADFLRRYAVA